MFVVDSLFVLFAAFLWATDSVFRYPLISQGLSSVSIVFAEHMIVLFFLIAFVLYKKMNIFNLSKKQWVSLFFIGIFSSALATVLFTLSFQFGNPSVSILLQKIQPLVVILLSLLFLKENPPKYFYLYAAVAIIAGVFLSFPDFNFNFLNQPASYMKSGLLAFSAAVLWASGTVVGKSVVINVPATVVIFWRYVFGAVGVYLIAIFQKQDLWSDQLFLYSNVGSLFYMALIVGLLSMILYYKGLKKVLAAHATILELIFPISAVALNYIFLDQKLSVTQFFSALVLLASMTQISRKQISRAEIISQVK